MPFISSSGLVILAVRLGLLTRNNYVWRIVNPLIGFWNGKFRKVKGNRGDSRRSKVKAWRVKTMATTKNYRLAGQTGNTGDLYRRSDFALSAFEGHL
jgi:hypothetical protein